MTAIKEGPFAGLPRHHYGLIAADPPWRFLTYTDDPGNRAPKYPTMPLDEIKALPVYDLAGPNCWLMLWTSGPFLDLARETMRAWGFKFSTIGFTWVKLRRDCSWPALIAGEDFHRGLGKVTRKNTELVLFGKLGQPRVRRKPNELIVAPLREHSRKPDEFFPRAEGFCDGPRLELFGRERRAGWDIWGNQTEFFDAQDAG